MKWKDICINEQYLYVHQTMQRIQKHNSTKGKTEIVILPPKSECSIRYIPIPSDIIQLLMPVQRQEEAFLLTGMAHSFIEPRCMENHFKMVAEECGIQNVNFHVLRHSCASLLLSHGFTLKDVQVWLGHSDIKMTANVYGHLDVARKQSIADEMSALLSGRR